MNSINNIKNLKVNSLTKGNRLKKEFLATSPQLSNLSKLEESQGVNESQNISSPYLLSVDDIKNLIKQEVYLNLPETEIISRELQTFFKNILDLQLDLRVAMGKILHPESIDIVAEYTHNIISSPDFQPNVPLNWFNSLFIRAFFNESYTSTEEDILPNSFASKQAIKKLQALSISLNDLNPLEISEFAQLLTWMENAPTYNTRTPILITFTTLELAITFTKDILAPYKQKFQVSNEHLYPILHYFIDEMLAGGSYHDIIDHIIETISTKIE